MAVGPIARDDESAEFFEATAKNVLLTQRCEQCGRGGEVDLALDGDHDAITGRSVLPAETHGLTVQHRRFPSLDPRRLRAGDAVAATG